MNDPRQLTPDDLSRALDDARRATLLRSLDLDEAQWMVPFDPGIQPTAWDLGHIAWFAEFWMLRGPHGLSPDGTTRAARPPQFLGPDEHYDSARVDHPDRWRIELHDRPDLLDRLAGQLVACQAAIAAKADDADTLYFAQLTLYHELMHVEALAWTRSLCGYPAPSDASMPRIESPEGEGPAERVDIAGGEFELGTRPEAAFAFDNERPTCQARIEPFSIDRHPVANGAFRRFVEDDGYTRAEFWPDAAGRWLRHARRQLPIRWRRTDRGDLEHRWYDSWSPLPDDEPIVHISAYEAEAYCRWADSRLPTAAEWEAAAPETQWGRTVWEWTATTFAPYDCFRPGPYSTYSAPWFHHQRELRGGAYATHALMHDQRYRNFFLPQRTDIFSGFRTVARA